MRNAAPVDGRAGFEESLIGQIGVTILDRTTIGIRDQIEEGAHVLVASRRFGEAADRPGGAARSWDRATRD